MFLNESLKKAPSKSPTEPRWPCCICTQSSVFFHSMEERGCVHKQERDPVWSTRGMSGIPSHTLAALWADDVTRTKKHTYEPT